MSREPSDRPPVFSPEELDFLHRVLDLARQGASEQVLDLIDQGIPVDLTDHKGDTLTILAAYHDHQALVAGLIEAGADPDRVNDRGQTALTCAVFRQNEPMVRLLLAAGADPRRGEVNALATAEAFDLPALRALLDPSPPRNHTPPPTDSAGATGARLGE